MKSIFAILGFASFLCLASTSTYSPLVGKWAGRVEKNVRNKSAGGNPSEGEVGTPVNILLRESTTQKGFLEGESRLGQIEENWKIGENAYVWKDETIEVTAKSVSFEEIPSWIKEDLQLKSTDQIYAFKFAKCLVQKTKQPCSAKVHYPEGMDETAHWVFKTQANQLISSVLYKYADGNKRILSETLTKE